MVDAPNPAPQPDRYRTIFTKLWNDPELGPAVRQLSKKELPDIVIPEDTFGPLLEPFRKQNAQLADELKALREERAAERKQREDEAKAANDADFAVKIKQAREAYSLTDEGFEKMVAHMKATGNYTDPMGAAAYIVSQNPPPPPNTGPMFGHGDLNFAGSSEVDENYALLHRSPEKYLDAEIRKAWGPGARDYVAKEMGEQYANLAFGR